MKIGILTYHFANNYGAMLQAYSLQNILTEMGVDVQFVDFCSKMQSSNNSLYLDASSFENIIKNIIRLPYYNARKKRISKFMDFRNKYLNISDFSFFDSNDVVDFIDENFDKLIVGSDQVWNPLAPDYNEIYYWVSHSNIPTYAYAVSLGKAKTMDIKKYREEILAFSGVSVRESASIPIIQNIDTKINVKSVLDPTLLVDISYFKDIATLPSNNNENYVLCYFLGRKNAIKFRKAAIELAKKFGLKIIFINANYGIASYYSNMISDCGPEEFLGYIQHARFVCTNSFHAVAISIQFGVPFFSFETSDMMDTRKIDLLKRLDMEDRIIIDYNVSDVRNFEMDKEYFEDKMEVYRRDSISFLNEIIEK